MNVKNKSAPTGRSDQAGPLETKKNKTSSASPLGKLLQAMQRTPSSQGARSLTSQTINSNPLSALKQPKESATPLYKKHTLVANKSNAAQLDSLKCDAKLANFAYTRDIKKLQENYLPDKQLALSAAKNIGITMKNVVNETGAVVDSKSGLAASIVVHKDKNIKEIVVIFGGTTAGKKVGADLMTRSRPGMNFMTTLSQWGANFLAGVGIEPKSYKQAAALLTSIKEEVNKNDTYKGYSVRVVGHSKGGGEAMYASMMQTEPVLTTTFCPAHLSEGLINKIPPENLKKATEFINSYSPYGDPVSALRGKLPDMPGIGNGTHFNGIKGSNPIDLHDQFLTHVEHFCTNISPTSYV